MKNDMLKSRQNDKKNVFTLWKKSKTEYIRTHIQKLYKTHDISIYFTVQ